MTMSKNFNILDVTVRDGSYLLNHQYKPEDVAKIGKGLYEAGIAYAEVSHGCGIGSYLLGIPSLAKDEALLQAVKEAAPDLKLSVFISPNDPTLDLIDQLKDYFEIGRVGANVHEIKLAQKFIERLKKFSKKVSLQLVRSHARDPQFVGHMARRAELMGVDIVYLVDTYGSFKPEELKPYIEEMKSKLDHAQVGFHGHNHLGLANTNAYAAITLGVDWVDASLMGVGRGAGNTCLEDLITELQTQNQWAHINLAQLEKLSKNIVLPIFKKPPQASIFDRLCGKYKIDYAPESHFIKLAELLGLSIEGLMKEFRSDSEFVDVNSTNLRRIISKYGKDYDEVTRQMSL
ncbi:MAG: hypothetical protein HYU97_01960 [Deltaproteobacteria bacterium]|nr:hypothetical protein [Deltaproteobacteria bacterium]